MQSSLAKSHAPTDVQYVNTPIWRIILHSGQTYIHKAVYVGMDIVLVHHDCLYAVGRENFEVRLQVCAAHSCPVLQKDQD